jgi:hypothetical protein
VFILVMIAIAGAVVIVPLQVGIWLPDVFLARRHTLASHTSTNGYRFRVVQYWNRVDFYSTELHITSPTGQTDVRTLDGDDSKSWSVPMSVDEQSRVVLVILGGGRMRTETW